MQLSFQDALLIAVRAEALRPIFDVSGRTDAVALHAARAQIRHVGRAGAHCWQGDGPIVVIPDSLFDDSERFRVEPGDGPGGAHVPLQVFGTDEMVAAGINYATDLAIAGYRPMVINMSLGGSVLDPVEKAALDRAIANGVIVVAAAGNAGDAGMGFPGAYAPVISVAAAGWNNSWVDPAETFAPYRMFWLHNDLDFVPPLEANSGDVPEPTPTNGGQQILDDGTYIANFSSRELAGQELDLAAPGVWVRGPFAGFPGYSHLPWWSKGIGDLFSTNPSNFYYVSGTSMATPHVAAAAAMMLEADPTLTQSDIEDILTSTAIPIPPGTAGDVQVGFLSQTWGANATGAGLLQVDEAIGEIQ